MRPLDAGRLAGATMVLMAVMCWNPLAAQVDSAEYWDTRCRELREDKFSNRTVQLSQAEFLEYLRQLEEINPDKNWKQIAAALHGASYTDDLDRTLPGTPLRLFENGRESAGWERVDLGCDIGPLSNHAPAVVPKFVTSARGQKIDVGHTYAGIRSDLNRSDQSAAWSRFMRSANTNLGDMWQVLNHRDTEYFTADQLRGNLMGLQIARHARNPHLQDNIDDLGLVDFFEHFFDNVDAANEREAVVTAAGEGSDGERPGESPSGGEVGGATTAAKLGEGTTSSNEDGEHPESSGDAGSERPDIPGMIAGVRTAIRLNAEGAEGLAEYCLTLEQLPALDFGEGSPDYFYKNVFGDIIVSLLTVNEQYSAQIDDIENGIDSAVRASRLAVKAGAASCEAAQRADTPTENLDGQIERSNNLSNLAEALGQSVQPDAETLYSLLMDAESPVPDVEDLKQQLQHAESERQARIEQACANMADFSYFEARLRPGGFLPVSKIKERIAVLRAAIFSGTPDMVLEYGLEMNALHDYARSMQDVKFPEKCTEKVRALGAVCKAGDSVSGSAGAWLADNQERLSGHQDTLDRISAQRREMAERLSAKLEQLRTALQEAILAADEARACRDLSGEATAGESGTDNAGCSIYAARIEDARPLLHDGKTADFRREIETIAASVGESERLACPDLEDGLALARQQAELIEQVISLNRDVLLSCNAAAMQGFADRLRSTDHPFVSSVRERIEALISAVNTYRAALNDVQSGNLEAAEAQLDGAHLRIQRIAPESCPNIRTGIAEAIKIVAERRNEKIPPEERVEEADRHCRNYLGQYANAVRDDSMESGYRCNCVKPDGKPCREDEGSTQSASDRNRECVRLNGRGFYAGSPHADGRYDCIPTRQTANAWCANNSGRDHYAGRIGANGSFRCAAPQPKVQRRPPPLIGLVPPAIGLVTPPTNRTGASGGGGCVPCPSLFLPADEAAVQCRAGGYTTNRGGSWYKCL